MSIVSSIINSKDDLVKPEKKSYGGCDLDVRLEDVAVIKDKQYPFPSEIRALLHEFSGKEPVKEFVVLTNRSKMGRLTTFQIKEMFNDMGFNVGATFGGKHFSDFDAVMNIGGYNIPGWVKFARIISKLFPSQEMNLLRNLSPGRDRLHVRFFENNDGSWLLVAHTEHNWLSLNLANVYKAHVGYGAGDYITGTIMLYLLLREFAKKIKENKVFSEKDIQKVLAQAYNQSIIKKLNVNSLLSLATL
jgi:hypothetical protein